MRHILLLVSFLCASVALFAENVNLNFFVGSTKILTASVTEGNTYTLSEIISDNSIVMSSYECRDYEFVGWKVGQPVEGTETPIMPTTVTPADNMNLYAVFEHTDDSKINNFIRITSTDNLEANAEYLIICYYVYGGEQQYYAMTNVTGTYAYEGTKSNRLNATRLYPRSGIITNPDESVIWTLRGTAGAWKWKYDDDEDSNDRWLRIGATDQTMLVTSEASGSSCAITHANGIFTIQNTSNSLILKYVDDYITEEEDYFITGTFSDYPIYIYKRESPYTSYPDCDPWTVNLDALEGMVAGTSPAVSTTSITESYAGSNVTLPEAELTDLACGGWSFMGWSLDAPIKSTAEAPANLISAGEYSPLYNGVTLYAAYQGTGEVTYYERVTSLTSGKDYIIVNYDGDQAVSTDYSGGSVWTLNNIAVDGTRISEEAATRAGHVTWRWSGSYFEDKDGNYLAYNRSSSYQFNPSSAGSPYFYLRYSAYLTYYLYDNGNQTDEERTYYLANKHKFSFYEKKTGSATVYSPYPHCAPYTVHLHACGGNINGVSDVTLKQVSAITPITLPSATPACPDEGWEFVGWFPDEDKESFEHMEFTDFVAGGSEYVPDHEDMHLYAVYRRITDRFRIIGGAADIANGDTYIVTYYKNKGGEKYYDYVLSSQVKNGTLEGLEYQSPRDGTGFYLDISDSTGMWTINKEGNYWTFQNLDNNQYLKITSGGTSTTAGANEVYLKDKTGTNWAIYVSDRSTVSDYSYEMYCPDGEYITTQYLTSGYTRYYPHCYIYRRIKEYSSWPHCEPFTVVFDACGGTTEDDGTEKTEAAAYAGIALPRAYANTDCSKEGWRFAGWATEPLNDETDLQTFELYPAGTIYHPLADNTTLYAVYLRKTNHYKRITTVGRLHTGTNYIITTPDDKALANMPNDAGSPTAVTYVSVSPDAAHIITVENPSIEWRLEGVRGEYELYNAARDVYLDLSEPSEARLTKTTAVDNFDITYDGSAYLIRSCISIAHYDGNKFLGLNTAGTYFTATDTTKASTRLKIYRQQSSYSSYPNCTDDIDVIKWAKLDDEFNTVTVESYHLKGAPDVHGSYGSPVLQADGTYLITFRNVNLPPCTKATVEWDGVTSRLRIPYIVSNDDNLNSASLLNGTARDCSECDVYIEPGNTLTVTATDTIRKLYVPDNATLNIANDQTLSMSIFSLFSEGDQAAPQVNLNERGSIFLRDDRFYYDKRIDEARYYWFSLPFDAHVKEISFVNVAANDGRPEYYAGTDGDDKDRAFFIKYYNGAQRADDVNGGALATTYWTDVTTRGTDFTLKAGLGYEIGLADQSSKKFNGQDYTHTSRTFRFTMRPNNTWLTQERNAAGSKTTTVTPSTCDREKNAVHAGWNLIGNPYMHVYNTGTVPNDGNIRNGAWVEIMDAYGDGTGKWWVLDETRTTNVPYLTLYDPSKPRHTRYSQVLASSYNLRPFEAVFVQVNEGTTLNFSSNMSVTAMPAHRRFAESDGPIRTGIMINGADGMDRTGFVLSEDYTPAYEIGADLEKVVNSYTKKGETTYGLNLYSFNADDQQLAFNGLNPQNAQDTIRLGLTCPADDEYTFSFDADWYGVKAKYIEALELIDYQTNQSVDLLHNIYSFAASANQQINDRFAIVIRLKKHTDTLSGFEEYSFPAGEGSASCRKIIHDGHLYILRDNDIYSATGTKIK